MTPGYTLSRAAATDLASIYRYTRREFGKLQAERYLAALVSALDLIADHPLIGAEKHEFTPTARMHPHDHHVILYRIETGRPHIVRIVAGRQRWQTLLSGQA